jgi:hypothetical protein
MSPRPSPPSGGFFLSSFCSGSAATKLGTIPRLLRLFLRVATEAEESTMPVILLWGIPTLIVLGGGTYWLLHLHH